MKKFIGVVFFMLVVGQLFAQASRTYYHIQVYARMGDGAGSFDYTVDDSKLVKTEGYYQFYHKNTGYAFFVYATKGDVSAVTVPPGVDSVYIWSGTSSALLKSQIDKIVTIKLLTLPEEVKRLNTVLDLKLAVPR
ncbi:hypothetical protein AGMMS50268_02210 [Spirochaetia bacterium]|nr:hypothetical protein AGMMS50268_02210 [Spirochaetia bacterium]